MSSLKSAILKWLCSSLDLGRDLIDNELACSDGVTLAKALAKIDSQHFDIRFVTSIKEDVPSDNVRLKSSNVKKVLNGIMEYYSDILNLQLSDFPTPDVVKVAEGNSDHTGRLLQLILGCAVNCDDKSKHIESIMMMEESVQQVIMQAIQELMSLQVSPAEPSLPAGMNSMEVRRVVEELAEANREREELKQKCHDLENKVTLIEDEKSNLSHELEQLMKKGVTGGDFDSHKSDSGIMSQEMKKQMEKLQEELYKSESQRDDLQAKVDLLEQKAEESQTRETELQALADEAIKLKDEVDILRETADKATKYEATIETYKKKLEDLGDLRRQMKILEEKNTEYVQKNVELEEELKKNGNWKPQLDTYKKQITELRAKVDSETKRADRLDFETKKLLEKVEALSVERDRLQQEKEDLRVKNDELVDDIKFGQVTRTSSGQGGLEDDEGNLEMIPPAIKERLLRLQHENKRLKASQSGDSGAKETPEVLQSIIDDLKEREKSLEGENRKANQKIMELESRLEENSSVSTTPPRVPGSREELELKISEKDKKIAQLQDIVQKKDVEIVSMEERYKKYIEKAKFVIKTMDPKATGGPGGAGPPEMATLRSQIAEKDRLIETLEQETEKSRAVREMEDRLLSSAFYNLSMQMHRSAVENRLSSHGAGGVQDRSFLARQRAVNSRPVGKSSDFLDY